MNDQLTDLIGKIKKLEQKLTIEIQKKEEEFFYKIRDRKIYFDKATKRTHAQLAKKVYRYLLDANVLTLLTVPVIWLCLLPGLLLDATVTIYQAICFPVYKIPKVKRSEYIVIDRHALRYLNPIEKINCMYCGYFNGVISYAQEIAARTEQYWCPIKHARKVSHFHSRYHKFLEYGDAESYCRVLEQIRKDFSDLA